MFKSHFTYVLFSMILIAFSAVISPVYAASVNFLSVTSVFEPSGCNSLSSMLDFTVSYQASATNNDIGGADVWSFVLSDSMGTDFWFYSITEAVGYNANNSISFSAIQTPLPVSRPFTLRAYDLTSVPGNITQAKSGPVIAQIVFNPTDYYGACTKQPPFADGRINNWDTGNPVVAYGHDFEDGRGLVVYSTDNRVLLIVTPEQIANVPDCPKVNTLIADNEVENIWLYRLSSCEYQLMAASLDGTKTYVLIFNKLFANEGYVSYEE